MGVLEGYKWIAFGDSLTDDTGACGEGAPNKYHKVIAEATGMDVTVAALGGTGYWRNVENGTNYYKRMAKLAADPDVDVVTIFGSVNDWRYWSGVDRRKEVYYNIPTMGFDKNGEIYTFAEFQRQYGNNAKITVEQAKQLLSLNDTVATTQNTQYGVSWVAYVNECINIAHEKFPNAKVVLVDEIFFVNTRFNDQQITLRNIKQALVETRVANGDTWLSIVNLEKCTFAGLDVPERLYADTIPGKGLSFDQLTDKTFADYYSYDGNGHPNDLYNRIWLAPVFANIIAKELAVDPNTLPDTLKMTEAERAALYSLRRGADATTEPDTPGVPDVPDTPITPTQGGVLSVPVRLPGGGVATTFDELPASVRGQLSRAGTGLWYFGADLVPVRITWDEVRFVWVVTQGADGVLTVEDCLVEQDTDGVLTLS